MRRTSLFYSVRVLGLQASRDPFVPRISQGADPCPLPAL